MRATGWRRRVSPRPADPAPVAAGGGRRGGSAAWRRRLVDTCPPSSSSSPRSSRGSWRSARSNLQHFVFPKPSAILVALQANWTDGRFPLLPSAIATLQEALLGLLIGTLAGLAVAFVAARFVTARGVLLPLAVAANAVPIIAFAPLINNWFGADQPALEGPDGRGARVLPGDGERAPRPRPTSSRRRSS